MERSLETARPVVLEALAQACSQNADILKPAEQKLQQWETEPGFYSILTVNMVLFSSLNRLANAQFVLSILKFLSFFSFFQYIACLKKKKKGNSLLFFCHYATSEGYIFSPSLSFQLLFSLLSFSYFMSSSFLFFIF